MTLSRVSTYNMHQSLMRDTSRVQAELANIQNQVSSGVRSSDFAGLSGQVEQFTDLEQKIGKSKRYIENNAVAITRVTVTEKAVGTIIDIANSFKNLLVQRRSASTSQDLAFDQQLDGYWKSLSGQLNSSLEGRFLFSGSKTDVKPVDENQFPQLAVEGVPDDGYYLGSDQDVTLRAQDNFDITYNIRADNPAFQKVAAAMATARQASTEGDQAKFEDAYNMIQDGLQDLISVQSSVNITKVSLEQINERHDSLQLYWKGVKEELFNTDMVSASTEVAINQGILQASYQVFARLSALRLSDFLR